MVRYRNIMKMVLAGLLITPAFTACSDSNDLTELGPIETEEQAFGKATGNFTAEEWFPGGQLGTTEKASYSAPTPAVQSIAGMEEDFNTGEDFFEHLYTFEQAPRRGLGPLRFFCHCDSSVVGDTVADVRIVILITFADSIGECHI